MRKIFIGDVHGCRDELIELLNRLAPAAEDRVVLLGDLLDRGPDPVGVVRLARELGADCLLGNHEEKALRWLRHEQRRAVEPDYRNPMRPIAPERRAQWADLNEEDVAYLKTLRPFLEIDGWVAVHAGLLPGVPLEQQDVSRMIRCRWVDESGGYVRMREDTSEMPPGARVWTEAFDGHFNVVCGHAVHSREGTPASTETPRAMRSGLSTRGACSAVA